MRTGHLCRRPLKHQPHPHEMGNGTPQDKDMPDGVVEGYFLYQVEDHSYGVAGSSNDDPQDLFIGDGLPKRGWRQDDQPAHGHVHRRRNQAKATGKKDLK